MQKTLLFLFLTAHCAILYLLLASFGTGVAVVSAALIPPPITLPDSLADYYSNHHQQQQQNQYEYEHGHASSSSSSFSLDASSSDSSDPDPPSQGELLNAIFSVRRFSSEVFRVIVPPCTDELSVSLRRLGPAAHTISLELRHNAFPTQLAQDTIVVNRTNFTYNVVVPRPKAGTWIALVLYDNSTGRTAMHPLYDSNKVTLRMSMTATTFSGPVHEATHLGAQPQYFVAQPSPTEGEMVFSFSVAPRTSLLAVNVLATSGTQACLRYGALPLANSLAGTRCWAPLNTSDTNTSFALSVHVPEEGLWFLSITGTETEAENEVWLSVSESVCPSGLAGEDCSGVLSETERSLPGSYSAFEYLRDNRSDEGWVYFMYDHTYSQVFGDTLYFGPLSLYANATLYLRRNAPPTKDTYDLTLNDLDNYKVVHPEHTVWCKIQHSLACKHTLLICLCFVRRWSVRPGLQRTLPKRVLLIVLFC